MSRQWLSGKMVRLIGRAPAVADALARHGATINTAGDPDILVQTIDHSRERQAENLTHAEWRQLLDRGLDQCFFEAQRFAASRRQQHRGGAILFLGQARHSGGLAHAAASGALGNLTRTLAVEWARDGIRVNLMQTDATLPALGNLAAYLVSDYAAYVTGALLGVGVEDI